MNKQIINDCCGETPIVWKCDCNSKSFCGCDVEKIECSICDRIVYGADNDDIIRWNNGDNDK